MKIILHAISFGCLLLTFFLVFVGFYHPITALNEDLGRHIVLGNIMLQERTVPKINLFSYAYSSYPFVNSHWLSEIIFALIVRLVGLNGLLLFSTIVTILTFACIVFCAMKRSPFLTVVFGTGLYSIMLLERTDIRPELFSFLFLVVFLIILYKYREGYTRLIYLLLPVQVLWVNMHIYFVLGILVPLLFFIEMLVISKFRLSFSTKRLGLVIIFITFTTLCNPNFVSGALFPFTYSQNYGLLPIENHTLFYVQNVLHTNEFFYAEIILCSLFILLLVSFRQARLIDWLLSVTFSILFFLAIRNLPLFIYATIIAFVYALTQVSMMLRNFLGRYMNRLQLSIVQTGCFFSLFLIVLFAMLRVILFKGIGWGTDEPMKGAVDFFVSNHLHGPIYNNIDIGSYLTYRLYPSERIFVDPRPEAYPDNFFTKIYIPMKTSQRIFTTVDNIYHFNTIIFSLKGQLPQTIQLLLNQKQYSLVYLDDNAMVFVKNNQENAQLIQRYAITQKTFSISASATPDVLVRYLYFFDKAGWINKETLLYKQLATLDPTNCILDQHDAVETVSILQHVKPHIGQQCW